MNYRQKYYLEHKERETILSKKYYQNNKERLNEINKKYNEEHREALKIYNKKYRVEHYEASYRENQEIMKELKINGCAICGYDKCINSLDFHHVNPEDKKHQVMMSFLSSKAEKIRDEINKCILLCKNCHYEIHYNNKKIN